MDIISIAFLTAFALTSIVLIVMLITIFSSGVSVSVSPFAKYDYKTKYIDMLLLIQLLKSTSQVQLITEQLGKTHPNISKMMKEEGDVIDAQMPSDYKNSSFLDEGQQKILEDCKANEKSESIFKIKLQDHKITVLTQEVVEKFVESIAKKSDQIAPKLKMQSNFVVSVEDTDNLVKIISFIMNASKYFKDSDSYKKLISTTITVQEQEDNGNGLGLGGLIVDRLLKPPGKNFVFTDEVVIDQKTYKVKAVFCQEDDKYYSMHLDGESWIRFDYVSEKEVYSVEKKEITLKELKAEKNVKYALYEEGKSDKK